MTHSDLSGTKLAEAIVHNNRFQPMAASCSGTAAQALSLVIWFDTVQRGQAVQIYRHHDFFSLYIVKQGRGTHVIDGLAYAVCRGDVYVMGPGMTHHFANCDDLVTHTLHFAPDVFDAPTLDALARTPGFQSLFVEEPLRRAGQTEAGQEGGRWLHLTPDAYAPIAALLSELRTEWAAGTPDGTLLARGLFVRLLVQLARSWRLADRGREMEVLSPAVPTGSRAAQEATIAAAVGFMEAHFTRTLRIEQVAASVFLSPDRFTEVFAQIMGRTPRDYLRHLRVERAKRLLATTDLSVCVIGLQAGFGEAAYFARAFRQTVGTTPRDYRRAVKREG